MIISAETTQKNLKHLLEREAINAKFSVSKERKEDFKSACNFVGFKKYTTVLEDLITQVNENFFLKDKKLKIEIEGFNDRTPTSFNCESETWKIFDDGCSSGLNKVNVIEFVMGEYISQIEAKNKIKIKKGKVKK